MNVNDPGDHSAVNRDESDFRVVVSEHAHETLVIPAGELDLDTAQELEAVLATQSGAVVVDLRELTFIDLTGVRLLLEADARSRQDGKNLRFIPSRIVRRLLEVAELPDRLTYVEPGPT
jgi:anti-sigma B factor antagonist